MTTLEQAQETISKLEKQLLIAKEVTRNIRATIANSVKLEYELVINWANADKFSITRVLTDASRIEYDQAKKDGIALDRPSEGGMSYWLFGRKLLEKGGGLIILDLPSFGNEVREITAKQCDQLHAGVVPDELLDDCWK